VACTAGLLEDTAGRLEGTAGLLEGTAGLLPGVAGLIEGGAGAACPGRPGVGACAPGSTPGGGAWGTWPASGAGTFGAEPACPCCTAPSARSGSFAVEAAPSAPRQHAAMEIHRQAAAAIPRVEMTVLLMKEGSDSQVPV